MAVQLRVILEEHDIRKLTLPTGFPNTVEGLLSVLGETFQLEGSFGLLYEDKDFGNQFFSLTSTAELYDKATLKVIRIETVTLDLQPLETSGLSALSSLDNYSVNNSELAFNPANDDASSDVSDTALCSSKDTIILPDSCRSAASPVPFQVPEFSRDIKLILAEANRSYEATGIPLRDPSVKSAIMHDLSKAIFSYSAYLPNWMDIPHVFYK